MRRRDLLAGLMATACAPTPGPLAEPPPLPLALGWRLSPGDLFSLIATTERRAAGVSQLRSEQWIWRVLRVEHGVAHISAHPTALGAGSRVEGELTPIDAEPSEPTELALARDGVLHAVSDPSLFASLPHYALALGLPDKAVGLHEQWSDPIGRVAATLLPEALEPEGTAHTALRAVNLVEGRAIAALETRGEVRSQGPQLELAGTARWDLLAGRLLSRTLEIRPSRLGGAGEDPGVLSIHLRA